MSNGKHTLASKCSDGARCLGHLMCVINNEYYYRKHTLSTTQIIVENKCDYRIICYYAFKPKRE